LARSVLFEKTAPASPNVGIVGQRYGFLVVLYDVDLATGPKNSSRYAGLSRLASVRMVDSKKVALARDRLSAEVQCRAVVDPPSVWVWRSIRPCFARSAAVPAAAARRPAGRLGALVAENLRVEAARTLMEQSSHSIDVVARQTGFDSLCRRLSRLGAKSAAELPRAQMGRSAS
jgi:hypothetical protein